MDNPYKVGDLVRAAGGKKCMQVMAVNNNLVLVSYDPTHPNARSYAKRKHFRNLAPWNPDKDPQCQNWGPFTPEMNQKEDQVMTKLFQTKEDTPRFGTQLAVNSAGQIVLEIKGTGEVVAFSPRDIEEVVPYTYNCRAMNGSEYVFSGKPGTIQVGDILVSKSGLCFYQVTKLDTKVSDGSVMPFEGVKLLTTTIDMLPTSK